MLSKSTDSQNTLEDLLRTIHARKIVQTGIRNEDDVQVVLRVAQYLKQNETRNSMFYAIAADPLCYLNMVGKLRDHALIHQVQALVGTSLPYDSMISPTADLSTINAAKYLPNCLLQGCLLDIDHAPDLVILCGAATQVAEVSALQQSIKSSSHLLIISETSALSRTLPSICSEIAFSRYLESPSAMLFSIAPVHRSERSRPNSNPERKKIAIVLTEHMGDIVACEPVARYVRDNEPDSIITWVVGDKYKELVEDNPYLDQVLTVDCLNEWSLVARSGLFDEIIDLHINERECPHCGLSLKKWKTRHDITLNNYLDYGPLLSAFSLCAGLPPLANAPKVYISDSVRNKVDSFFLPSKYVVFHCLSNEYSRDWDEYKWKHLAKQLIERWDGSIIEVGSKSLLNSIDETRIINLSGKLSILESAEVIRRSNAFVGVESGPAHLANAVGTHGVVLMGEYRGFKRYSPYTGNYSTGDFATILYPDAGPARNLSIQQVLHATLDRLELAESENRTIIINETAGSHQPIREDSTPAPRLIAFHLPQFHPIPENDLWWGKGFTEWRNVTKGMPLFEGHYQPHLPGDLGFYDMRLPETLNSQCALARDAGVHGFCFWHYWFNGKLLLERPIEQMIKSGEPDFPFCLAWANENWTRRWDGQDSEILMRQSYGGVEDAKQHFNWLIEAFNDRRYIQVDGRPVFLIYRPFDIPQLSATLDLWRNLSHKHGTANPFFVAIRTNFDGSDPLHSLKYGFDAEMVFQPNSFGSYHKIQDLLKNKNLSFSHLYASENYALKTKGATVCDYSEAWPIFAESSPFNESSYSCVVPSWDNTSRRAHHGAFVLHNSTPSEYESWLLYEITKCREQPLKDPIVFINAWNEWAEGNHLEPDIKHGDAYLRATRRAILKSNSLKGKSSDFLCQAKAKARVLPLIKRIIKKLHGRQAVDSTYDLNIEGGNIISRINEMISSPASFDDLTASKYNVLMEVLKELLKTYNGASLLVQFYNCASALTDTKLTEQAKLLFIILAETTAQVFPELCGKSHYKLALLSATNDEALQHLALCLELYPEHRAARKLLDDLSLAATEPMPITVSQ